jgi:hypothetical protein
MFRWGQEPDPTVIKFLFFGYPQENAQPWGDFSDEVYIG